ncbi:MAG: murein biosynthesis integral membrane protein MurJ [Elusimicrobia bacterium]|nr:murein biosynthesis integral membrane protein MurJ [Elusimicrobiota bacterium]
MGYPTKPPVKSQGGASSDHAGQLVQQAASFSWATLLSRILGYVRDCAVAHAFGAGLVADAFYAAFRISNLLRRLLGEGALSAAFIPVFTEYLEQRGEGEARRLFQALTTLLVVLVGGITVLGIWQAPLVTRLIAAGFEQAPGKFTLTVLLTRLMFPFFFFVVLAALAMGVLNAGGVFFTPGFAPAMLSLAELGFIWGIAPHLPVRWHIQGLAVSAVVGGIAQWAIQLPALWRRRMSLGIVWEPQHEGIRRVGRLMTPAIFGLSVDQINAFFGTICASFLREGSMTALYYSNRVMQLPLALFGIAMASVSLPAMSASVARADRARLKETINASLRLSLFFIVPAMIGLLTLGSPILEMLFERGRFTHEATRLTNQALAAFALGLVAYSAVKVLANAFNAQQETRIPVRIAMGCVGLDIVLTLSLMGPFGVGGVAFATAAAAWVNAGGLFLCLRRRIGLLGGKRLLHTGVRVLLISAIMGAVCRGVIAWAPWSSHTLTLLTAILIGVFLYASLTFALRMEEALLIWRVLRGRR